MQNPEYEKAKRAKEVVREQYQGCDWVTGIGIAVTPDGYGVRLNVDPDADVSDDDLPKEALGLPVEIVRMKSYKAQ